jgi:hypothetical protein
LGGNSEVTNTGTLCISTDYLGELADSNFSKQQKDQVLSTNQFLEKEKVGEGRGEPNPHVNVVRDSRIIN